MEPVLILGSRLIDGRPGRTLTSRLNAALPYTRSAETIVVSGYRGEAEAMRDWLVARGVPETAIAIENRARSTNENLERAAEILRGYPRWIVVTSDFHAWRTRLWAWHHGLDVVVIGARTQVGSASGRYSATFGALRLWLREAAALPHSLLRIAWRRIRARRER